MVFLIHNMYQALLGALMLSRIPWVLCFDFFTWERLEKLLLAKGSTATKWLGQNLNTHLSN